MIMEYEQLELSLPKESTTNVYDWDKQYKNIYYNNQCIYMSETGISPIRFHHIIQDKIAPELSATELEIIKTKIQEEPIATKIDTATYTIELK